MAAFRFDKKWVLLFGNFSFSALVDVNLGSFVDVSNIDDVIVHIRSLVHGKASKFAFDEMEQKLSFKSYRSS